MGPDLLFFFLDEETKELLLIRLQAKRGDVGILRPSASLYTTITKTMHVMKYIFG